MVGKAKVAEIMLYCLAHGEQDTREKFGLTDETFNRYKREYRKQYGDIDSLLAMKERFSPEELAHIAKGERPLQHNGIEHSFDGTKLKVGIISDMHFGSSYTDPTMTEKAFEIFDKEKVDIIACPGDLVEGMMGRPGDIYELSHIGYKAQRDETIRVLSKMNPNTPFFAISGNHDASYNSKHGVGANIVEDILSALPNAHYLGHDEGDIHIAGIIIRLFHGGDGSCFDDKTEILTKTGWKLFADLTLDDWVATMTKEEHEFQWQKPTNVFIQPYQGDMVHFNSRNIDCMVTPNHGMWTRVSDAATYRRISEMDMPLKSHRRLNTEWHRKDAGDIVTEYSRQKWQFTRVCSKWEGETPEYIEVPRRESKNKGKSVYHFGKVPVEDMAELIAWYVTEGHAGKSTVSISQYISVNPENHRQIQDLAERLGANYGVFAKGIRIHSVELSEYLRSACGHLSRHKYLPMWLKNCDVSILNMVVDTMIAGDGWVNGKAYGYRSISPQLLSDFAEIAVKCGYAVTFSPNKDTVNLSTVQVFPTVNTKPEIKKYTGNIYCCEVPNGLIYVRRNGKTMWTHNSYALSYRGQKIIEAITGGTKPNLLIAGHSHKSVYLFNRNIHYIEAGTLQTQSSWMRGKKLAAHVGFSIADMTIGEGSIKSLSYTWYPFYK